MTEKDVPCPLPSPTTMSGKNRGKPSEHDDLEHIVFDTLPFPIWIKDIKSRFLVVNKAFARLFSVTPQNLVGKSDFDLVPAEIAETYRLADQSVIRHQENMFIEEKIPDHGIYKWFETFRAPLTTPGGANLGTLGFARDISLCKAAEKRQAEGEERFRLIFENSGEAVLFSWADGRIESVNPAACKLFGFDEAEFRRRGRNGIMDTSDPQLTIAIAQRDRTGSFRGEFRCIDKNGGIFPVELISTLFKDSSGVSRAIVHIRDITQRKQIERLQEEQLTWLRLHHNALAAISQGVIITDANQLICYANPGFEAITGYTMSEIIGRNCNFLSGPETDRETLEKIRSFISARQQFHGEILNYRKDGTPFWNELSIIPMTDNNNVTTQLVGVLRDITADKLAKQQLHQYANEVEELYQNAPCGYHSLDANGVYVRINDTELKWLGYSREEVIGRKLGDFLKPTTLALFDAYFKLLKKCTVSPRVEVEFITRDGSSLPVLISATALRDGTGNFLQSHASVYDLRDHKSAEIERIRQSRTLEAMSRHLVATQEDIRRRLSADLHDRTSPNLAAISINLGILATELAARNSAGITARIEDTRALIEDTAASIREISSELRPPLLDYAGLLPAVENLLDDFSRRTGIAAQIHCESRQIRPRTELEIVLFRIIKEALTNCAKHSHATQVDITLVQSVDAISLTITDNGIGLATKNLKQEAPTGGLGLINIKEAAEFAGGTFLIDSQPGKGVRIHVTI